ncbi:MAG: winged helix-turn-helix domain-containing protein [Myxococcota bacterium]
MGHGHQRVTHRTVDTHMKRLREARERGRLIDTVRGVGYRFQE